MLALILIYIVSFFPASVIIFVKVTLMRKVTLGKTGLEISRISLGGLVMRECDQHQADKILGRAAQAGANYYDSAPTYADSQALFGNSPAAEKKNFIVGAKSAKRDYHGCMREIEQSLTKLKVDVIDIFQLHAVLSDDDWEERKAPSGALAALVEAREKGLVRYLGITGHNDPSVLARAIGEFDFDVVMPAVNYLYRYFLNPEGGLLPLAQKKNLGIIGIKPNIQGKAGDEKAAYRYVFAQRVHTAIPPGDPGAFFRALEIAEQLQPFSETDEKEFLRDTPDLSGICRQCGYCMRPQRPVDIPYLFRIEGKFRHFGHLKAIAKEEYFDYTATADVKTLLNDRDRIFCPWDIDIPARLHKLDQDIRG